jgi:hypothetical protein
LASRGHFRVYHIDMSPGGTCWSSWGETGLLAKARNNRNPRDSAEPLAESDEGRLNVERTTSGPEHLVRLVFIEDLNEDKLAELGTRYPKPT